VLAGSDDPRRPGLRGRTSESGGGGIAGGWDGAVYRQNYDVLVTSDGRRSGAASGTTMANGFEILGGRGVTDDAFNVMARPALGELNRVQPARQPFVKQPSSAGPFDERTVWLCGSAACL